ncbi:Hypothetical protein GLP15_3797 [Giardia lamblia P15]|uniref:Uncharacterized protein n=1 Tax=Giardia intestinalis (strain P15) TaxID=658858 RepID=E1F248_GIAIA|nr:Hypothetical protein GLP15_3797 [Giardia lamblia P15]
MLMDIKDRLRDHVTHLVDTWRAVGVDIDGLPDVAKLVDELLSSARITAEELTPLELHENLSRFLLEYSNPILLSIMAPFIEFHDNTPLLTLNRWNNHARLSGPTTDMFADSFMQEYKNTQLLADNLRRKFHVKDIEDIGAWEGCPDLYDPATVKSRLPYPETVPIYCTPGENLELPTVVPQEKFFSNWRLLTNGILDGIDWSNVVVAGGAVLACVLPGFNPEEYGDEGRKFEALINDKLTLHTGCHAEVAPHYICGLNGFWASDIDLFIHSCSAEEARKIIDRIIDTVTKNNASTTIMRSSFAVTIFGLNPHRDVQIVFRLYSRPCEVIYGFDIDCSGIAFDGTSVYVTPRCLQSLRCRLNVVNMTYRSTTYSSRLIKYAYRDFAIAVPGYDRNMGIPHLIPSKADFSHVKIWNSTAVSKHTRADIEQRYIRCLADIRTSGATSCLRTKAAPELSAIIAEDITIHHMLYCSTSRNPVGKDPRPLCIGGFRGPSCQCKIAKSPKDDLISFIITVAVRGDIANAVTSRTLTSERRSFAQGRRHYIDREDVTHGLVENAPLEDNSVEAVYRIINADSRGLDPLSIAYHHQHDYATPSSTGFHTKASLQWADKHPRCVNGIFIGPLEYVMGASPVTLLVDNPGRQGLLTSSFHPLLTNGFYGDMRWLVGPHTYIDFSTQSHPNVSYDPESPHLLDLLFRITHFYSHPSYFARILEASNEEQGCRTLADAALQCTSTEFTSFVNTYNLLQDGKKAAERGLLVCEESVKQLSDLESAFQSYVGSRCVCNSLSLTLLDVFDMINNRQLEAKSNADAVFGTQYGIFKSVVRFFTCINDRRHALATWKEDYDTLSSLLVEFNTFMSNVRISLLKGVPFKSECFQIDSSVAFSQDWLSLRQKLASKLYSYAADNSFVSLKVDFVAPNLFDAISSIKSMKDNANLDVSEELLKGSGDGFPHKYVYAVPVLDSLTQVDNLFCIVRTDTEPTLTRRADELSNYLSHTLIIAPDFSAGYAEVSIVGEPLLSVLTAAYSLDEVLYLFKSMLSVLRMSRHTILDPLLHNAYVVDRSHVVVVSSPSTHIDRYVANLLCCLKIIQRMCASLLPPNHPTLECLQRTVSAEDTPDAIDSLVESVFASVAVSLHGVFQPIPLPRCDIINIIYKGIAKVSSANTITHSLKGELTALNLLSAFKPGATFASLASHAYAFSTEAGGLTDIEYSSLLLEACVKEHVLVYDSSTKRYTLPTGEISAVTVEILRRLGRLLSWAFLHRRCLPLYLSNLMVALLKFGSTYTYAEETLHAVLADADNSDDIGSSIKCFMDSSANCITEFVSNSTGIRYILKTDGDALMETIPTIHISSTKRFAALYYTNELIHNRMMSIRAFLECWDSIDVLGRVGEMVGINLRSALNVGQLRLLLMDDTRSTL